MYFKVEKNCFQALKTFYPSHQALNESGVSDNFSTKMFFSIFGKNTNFVFISICLHFFVGSSRFDQQAYHLKPETNCLLFYSHPLSLSFFSSLFLSFSLSLFLYYWICFSPFQTLEFEGHHCLNVEDIFVPLDKNGKTEKL
jgi:hypothetical protein